jgi:predicted nucleic acid-binding protein
VICSFDSNVLVYWAGREAQKRARARELLKRALASGNAVLLLQTVAEFSYVGLRKLAFSPEVARRRANALSGLLATHAYQLDDLAAALSAVRDHQLGFWDALLWATANRVGVRYLFTEDLQDGRVLDGVRFVNPFNPKNDALIDRILPL